MLLCANLLNIMVAFLYNDNNEYKHDMRGNDSNLLIVFYVQIMPDDFVMQLHRF